MAVDTERPEWNGLTNKAKSKKQGLTGFLARLYQHEEAHLRGKTST